MTYIDDLAEPAVVSLILAAMMFIAWLAGVSLGRQLRGRKGAAAQFDAPSMAVLSLLLAFAFGTSMSKYDQRRIAVVQDSNAIGDFYTCATLLSEPAKTRLQTAIRRYAEQRLKVADSPLSNIDLEHALDDFQKIHEEMTILVNQALSSGTPIAVSLTNALNAVTSNQAARLAAIKDKLPGSVVALLFISTIVTVTLMGRKQGFCESSDLVGLLWFILLISFAVYVTLDLNQPLRGFIRVSQEPIARLLSSMTR